MKKEAKEEIDNFSHFIISSSKLFKLEDITAIQCCFNLFMTETRKLEKTASRKIFRDAIKFMENELTKKRYEKRRSVFRKKN